MKSLDILDRLILDILFSKKIFEHIRTITSWLDLLKILIEKRQLFAFKHDGVHITINIMN